MCRRFRIGSLSIHRRTTGIASLILLVTLLCPWLVKAGEAPLTYLSQQFLVTTPTANTFVNPSQLVQSLGRQACSIQYTGSGTGFVFFGSVTPTATTQGFQLANKNFIYCDDAGSPVVDGNAIWLTGSNNNDTFVVKVK